MSYRDRPVTLPDFPPSPLQRLHSPFLDRSGVLLSVKRDELIHPEFGGNKWRKLKPNLQHCLRQQQTTLLTFGGAWSNHIHATAAIGHELGIRTIGVIRGEAAPTPSATLVYAQQRGMHLHYVSRSAYRDKNKAAFIEALHRRFGDFYHVPEGGGNRAGASGCRDIIDEINQQSETPADIICCACGTGTTLAGIVDGLRVTQRAIGFAVLKGGDFLHNAVARLSNHSPSPRWRIETRYHFGGYARYNDTLLNFTDHFQRQYGIPLDYVYTAKLFYGLFKMIANGDFARGSHIVAVHSGGLQGNAGIDRQRTRDRLASGKKPGA